MLSSRVLGTTRTQSLPPASIALDLGERQVAPQLDRQRLAVAAHRADAHAERVDGNRALAGRPRPRILLVSAPPFHSSRLMPLPRSLSIHGIRLPASGTPKCSVGKAVVAQDAGHFAVDVEDRRRRIVEQVFAPRGAPRPSAAAARACSARRRPTPPGRSCTSSTRSGRAGTARRAPSSSGSPCSCRRCSSSRPARAPRRSRRG